MRRDLTLTLVSTVAAATPLAAPNAKAVRAETSQPLATRKELKQATTLC